MIPKHIADEAAAWCLDNPVQPITPGLRVICQFCKLDLPHSDTAGTRTSHGQCAPPCPETPEEWAAMVREAMKL